MTAPERTETHDARRTLAFALMGIVAAAFGAAIGEAVASFRNAAFAPIQVVASSAIDLPPAPVKEWATATFGTSAKSVVVIVVVIAVLALAAAFGVIARQRLWLGSALMLLSGGIGVLAGLRRPIDAGFAVVPSLAAGICAAIAMYLMGSLARSSASAPSGRRALFASLAFLGLGAVAYAVTRPIGGTTAPPVARSTPKLPIGSAIPLPASVQAPVEGLQPFVTPIGEFYRIDTTFVVPRVTQTEWSLTIDGMVARPLTITYQELLAMPMVDRLITIMCVSNPIGGDYIGNAQWTGTPLMPLLVNAGVLPGAEQLLSTSADGWTCSTPLGGLSEREPLLVIGMNGEPLPAEHGFPVRLVIPGLYGFISATKWVTKITAATYQEMPAYWTERGWATDAPVLTGSRIDLPREDVPAGPRNIAGIAWAMDGGGVSKVEVQLDDGPWQVAQLADEPNPRTWRQWWLPWQATPGEHEIRVRATNGEGQVQTEVEQDVIPSGATGYDSRRITVT